MLKANLELLNTKFSNALTDTLQRLSGEEDQAEIKIRSIGIFAQCLYKQTNREYQSDLANVLEEVFSDLTIAVYLAGLSLYKPAQVMLRRALELGVSVAYLWDQPAVYFNWRNHDFDLQFKVMVDYLTSEPYIDYLKSSSHLEILKLDTYPTAKSISSIYRDLSQVIHAKYGTHATCAENRFAVDLTSWLASVKLSETVTTILLNIYAARFPKAFTDLQTHLKSLSK